MEEDLVGVIRTVPFAGIIMQSPNKFNTSLHTRYSLDVWDHSCDGQRHQPGIVNTIARLFPLCLCG